MRHPASGPMRIAVASVSATLPAPACLILMRVLFFRSRNVTVAQRLQQLPQPRIAAQQQFALLAQLDRADERGALCGEGEIAVEQRVPGIGPAFLVELVADAEIEMAVAPLAAFFDMAVHQYLAGAVRQRLVVNERQDVDVDAPVV